MRVRLVAPLTLLGIVACGSSPPAAPTTPAPAPTPVAAAPKDPPIDTSPVPDPPGLVAVARLRSPEQVLGTVGSWTRLPIPNGRELVRSFTDDSVGDVVDLTQPLDAAVSVGISRRNGIDPQFAFAVAVPSYESAKMRLGQGHRLVPGPNGELRIVGIAKGGNDRGESGRNRRRDRDSDPSADQDDDDEDEGCVLAPAAAGAGRIVCGEKPALVSLLPYLTRTMPREKWSSDLHIELRPEPVRGPLSEFRGNINQMAGAIFGGGGGALSELVSASLAEAFDIVNDVNKVSLDAQIADTGLVATGRFDFRSNTSTYAKIVTSSDKAGEAPPAFWHLPAEADMAFFGKGSDPKLFERPRQLLANVILETADSSGMPPAEKQSLKDLLTDRMLPLFVSDGAVYGKGFDAAAFDKAMKAKRAVKEGDLQAEADAERAVIDQMMGWHLYQVPEPMAKVGPVFKDLSALWNRPAFAKWVKAKAGTKPLPSLRVAASPAGLPKDTVHLEFSVPIPDETAMAVPPPPSAPVRPGAKPVKPATPKKIVRKPLVFHILVVPDGSATWLGLGLDAKLVASRAAIALASAPDTNTIGKDSSLQPLREGKVNSAGMITMRSVAVLMSAAESGSSRDPLGLLGGLPHQGKVPLFLANHAEPPNGEAKAGSSVGAMKISRALIEDIVKLVMQMH